MNILLVNPYDYKTVQSNLGLVSLLEVLAKEGTRYAITIAGSCPEYGYNYIEMPPGLLDTGAGNVDVLKQRIAFNDITHIIAIDPEGAMVAMRLLEAMNHPDIRCSYISYEILFGDEIVYPREKILKDHDLAFLGRCREIHIQDEVRGRMFCQEVRRKFDKIFYAPVAPLQYSGRSKDKAAIRRRFNLPLEKKILIYSGSLSPYAKHDWWIRMAEILPDDYIFLFTCYDSNQLRDPNFARVGKILVNTGKVVFIRKELPVAMHLQLLQACNAGLALFRPVYTHWMNGRNIRYIGLSSGKFSTYISCGLPVICDDDQEIFRKLAVDYPIVQTISTPEEAVSKLKSVSVIGDQSDTWCRKLFDEILNPYDGIKCYLDALR